ncbi:TPA: HTH-type transcriptional activator IlvY [Mannheimia haemolytica]|uniref:HTH-type transcriptional activator CmpR n=1 Tax=Mannheimia haemolytica TaxID=75985 RepID=A0A249A2L4_MANHA|nr:HTH-type transcriptional activator IlvY [Mannheimia haemolytica]AWW71954.1 HTH-type transcriptional activator IlvY [Pasteurellaceae bacterium 12565]AGI33223.1 HTH-type transcriptional activator IlvY [Mannheimia haemolytica USDA-ARS-USMARC-183]AGI34812.1 HTH-type transcriptional activator IlvY [Mannheimia haemolytica USDA-ARS-USMARC-185]AGK01862.1 HTH domain-containing transcriptional dual regulator IlvY [Mannheimia haemolytica M42548]AJE07669.1 HTH-type transcriptional activator IlvY [Mannh
MDFQSLKLFLDIAQSRSFIRSAEKNYMTASTLTRHIQRIEEELGQPLFLRDNRQVRLTEAGERFLAFAQQGWAEWQQLQNQLSPAQGDLEGELKVFCSVTASYSHLPPILGKFRQKYPKVDIKLSTGDPALALEQVQSLAADISVAGKPEFLPNNIVFHYIDDIQLSIIAPRVASQATQFLQQSPIDWKNIPFILPVNGPVRKRIDRWFKEQKIKDPIIYATVSGHEAIVPMVALGFGVALLPDIVIKHSPMNNQVSYVNLPSPITPFELGICVQQKRLQEPIINAFWQLLSDNSA